MKFENPIWWPGLIQGLLWPSFAVLVALLWIWIDHGQIKLGWPMILGLFIAWSMGFYATGFGGEIIHRPKYVQIAENGVILYHRLNGRIEEVSWEKIFDVTIPKKKGPLESGIDGSMGISKRKRWTISIPILIKIREKYIEKMGRAPFNLRENG